MTIAELLILTLLLAGLLWVLRPLRRWIVRRLTRRGLRARFGDVVEADFRAPRPPRPPPEEPRE